MATRHTWKLTITLTATSENKHEMVIRFSRVKNVRMEWPGDRSSPVPTATISVTCNVILELGENEDRD
jgi:hypothetical protein